MFDVGDKIPEDRKQALKYMKMASEQGMADACYALAVWQERGYPTGQDPIDLYEKAAQQGNKNAMTSLIVRYEGNNPERQLYWYNKLNGRKN
jgi:TPR repeat protein